MSKHVSELTIEEIVLIGERAADRAVTEAAAKGITVTGYLPDAEGNLWLVRRAPDGAIEWIELRYHNEAPTTDAHKLAQEKKRVG